MMNKFAVIPFLMCMTAFGEEKVVEKKEQLVPGNQQAPGPVSWRERYELGPGDSINISLYGHGDLGRSGVKIAPDGTMNYLQAQSVNLVGKTLEEARIEIESRLSAYYKSPRVIITPQELGSKRFSILGKVTQRGNFVLDRPITLVEAVTMAGGIETGFIGHDSMELADFDRSFVNRRGECLKVNFRKLFLESDMSNNITIEPGDFIYIASNITNNYYIYGSVASTGMQALTPGATVAEAITLQGGYTAGAWLDHILVVRGSMDNPKTYVVNLKKILAGEEKDFPIEPKDIIYVNDRPWVKAEELLKLATRSFVSSASSTWVNQQIQPLLSN
jgi:polysaccharide biosynthesis/export protein